MTRVRWSRPELPWSAKGTFGRSIRPEVPFARRRAVPLSVTSPVRRTHRRELTNVRRRALRDAHGQRRSCWRANALRDAHGRAAECSALGARVAEQFHTASTCIGRTASRSAERSTRVERSDRSATTSLGRTGTRRESARRRSSNLSPLRPSGAELVVRRASSGRAPHAHGFVSDTPKRCCDALTKSRRPPRRVCGATRARPGARPASPCAWRNARAPASSSDLAVCVPQRGCA